MRLINQFNKAELYRFGQLVSNDFVQELIYEHEIMEHEEGKLLIGCNDNSGYIYIGLENSRVTPCIDTNNFFRMIFESSIDDITVESLADIEEHLKELPEMALSGEDEEAIREELEEIRPIYEVWEKYKEPRNWV